MQHPPGSEIVIRTASLADADELARLRWNFSPDEVEACLQSYPDFLTGFRRFWRRAVEGDRWSVWVAAQGERLVGNVWVERVDKVPRPGRPAAGYGYVTNVYVEPALRNQGIGSALLRQAVRWAREQGFEFLIVWPSEESRRYYERLGFAPSGEALELPLEGD
jgi:GNAT superfamily N-acetyltransferase